MHDIVAVLLHELCVGWSFRRQGPAEADSFWALSQDGRQGRPTLQPAVLTRVDGSSPARKCAALAGSTAWWDDSVLACIGASGLLAFLQLKGDSQIVERFATGERGLVPRQLSCVESNPSSAVQLSLLASEHADPYCTVVGFMNELLMVQVPESHLRTAPPATAQGCSSSSQCCATRPRRSATL